MKKADEQKPIKKLNKKKKVFASAVLGVAIILVAFLSLGMNSKYTAKIIPGNNQTDVSGQSNESKAQENKSNGFFDFFQKDDTQEDNSGSNGNSIFDIFKKPSTKPTENTTTGTQSNQNVQVSPSYPNSTNEKPSNGNSTSQKPSQPDGSNSITTTKPSEPEFDRFEYIDSTERKGCIEITKYTGNATHVNIPAKINSKYVIRIQQNAFKDNNKIKEISFETDSKQPYLWLSGQCFNNLQSLTTVNLPKADLGIINSTWEKCYSLKQINVESNQYKFLNGGLYYFNSNYWVLRYYAPAYTATTLTIPSWAKGIEESCNIEENPYLKTINLHTDAIRFPSLFDHTRSNLECINVEEGSTHAFSVDGVLFTKDTKNHYSVAVYPPKKKDKIFKVPDNTELAFHGNFTNEYLETLYLPKNATINQPSWLFYSKRFKNLNTIYLQKGSQYEKEAKDTFAGKVIIY